MKIESYSTVADCIFPREPQQYPHPACTSASVLAPFNPFFHETRLFLHPWNLSKLLNDFNQDNMTALMLY